MRTLEDAQGDPRAPGVSAAARASPSDASPAIKADSALKPYPPTHAFTSCRSSTRSALAWIGFWGRSNATGAPGGVRKARSGEAAYPAYVTSRCGPERPLPARRTQSGQMTP